MGGMRIFHIHSGGVQELTALPTQMPAQGFVWIACARPSFQAQLADIQTHLQTLAGLQLVDLHVSDLLNAQLPSHYDYTSQYDLLVFRRLATLNGDAAEPHVAAVGGSPVKHSGPPVLRRIDTNPVGFAVFDQLLLTVHPADCAVRDAYAARLLAALPATARVVLLGDKDQLASVEAGAVLGDLCRDAQAGRYSASTAAYALAATGEAIPAPYLQSTGTAPPLAQHTVMLRESRRFSGPIGELALAVNQGDAQAAQQRLAQDSGGALASYEGVNPVAAVRLALEGRAGALGGYSAYLDCMHQPPAAGDAPAPPPAAARSRADAPSAAPDRWRRSRPVTATRTVPATASRMACAGRTPPDWPGWKWAARSWPHWR